MELKAEKRDFTPVSDEPEADFRELAVAALHNAGIDTEEQLWAVQEAASNAPVNVHQLAVIEADEDKIVYKITFDLPDAGLLGEGQSQLQVPLSNDQNDTTIPPLYLWILMLLRRPCNATQYDLAGVPSKSTI